MYRQVGFAIVLILCLYSIRVYTRIDWRSLIAATVEQYLCDIYIICPYRKYCAVTWRASNERPYGFAKQKKYKKTPTLLGGHFICWHLPIFPGRHQPSIFGTTELNFCVRYGNRWTLSVINTNYSFVFISLSAFLPFGDSCGNRTRVAGVRGRSLRPLDQRAVWYTFRDSNPGHPD